MRRKTFEKEWRTNLQQLEQKLNVSKAEDWYKVTTQQLIEKGGSKLLFRFNGSISSMISSAYPETYWQLWKFTNAPKRFWQSTNNKREWFDWLGEKLGITDMDQWYGIHAKDLLDNGGSRVLFHGFKGSVAAALMATYPEHEWVPWRFERAPRGFWRLPENQRRCVEWLEDRLGIKGREGWYNVTVSEVKEKGGGGLIFHFGDSLSAILAAVYPDHNWQIWKFGQVPRGFWQDQGEAKKLVDWLREALKIKDYSDWYRISLKQISHIAPVTAFKTHGGLGQLLQKVYPEVEWDLEKFCDQRVPARASQRTLKLRVEELLPGAVVKEDFLHPELKFESGLPMQLDLFISELKLAFEYQGEQHYYDVYRFAPHKEYVQRDAQKKDACKKAGITLIEVPYWWDFSADSLRATVSLARPDLIPPSMHGEPIPLKAPSRLNEASGARGLLSQATEWNGLEDLTGWWLSEKIDGIRVYWDGSSLNTKWGKQVAAPPWFVDALPKVSLDGELWMGRGTFEQLSGTVNMRDSSWKDIEFCVFDLPGSSETYQNRTKRLEQLSFPPFVKLLKSEVCRGQDHLREFLDSIVSAGGEGVMARAPNSGYEPGRTSTLVKIKVTNSRPGLAVSDSKMWR